MRIKSLIGKPLKAIVGKSKFQSFFNSLFHFSLQGMNIGEGTFVDSSGELFALKYVSRKLIGVQHPVVFDVGANVGDYAKMLVKEFNKNSTIYCFEPAGLTYKDLISNTNQFENVHSFNIGLGSKEGEMTLYVDSSESLISSVYKRRLDHFEMEMDKTETIKVETIDSFCLNNAIAHINFLKVDVEGHELKVFDGAKKMISAKKIDYIQFEFGGCNIDSRTYFQDFYYFFKDKYQIYRIVKDGLVKIEDYKESYETFITTNYLAIKLNN